MSSPAQAIAAQLNDGKVEVLLVVGAIAVIVGLMALWANICEAAEDRRELRNYRDGKSDGEF